MPLTKHTQPLKHSLSLRYICIKILDVHPARTFPLHLLKLVYLKRTDRNLTKILVPQTQSIMQIVNHARINHVYSFAFDL